MCIRDRMYTGLRVGEALALTTHDIDVYKRQVLELHKSFILRNSKEVFIFVSLRRLSFKKGIIKMSYAIIRNANYKRENLPRCV